MIPQADPNVGRAFAAMLTDDPSVYNAEPAVQAAPAEENNTVIESPLTDAEQRTSQEAPVATVEAEEQSETGEPQSDDESPSGEELSSDGDPVRLRDDKGRFTNVQEFSEQTQFRMPDGRILRGQQIIGEMMMKSQFSREKNGLQDVARKLDGQRIYLERAIKSPVIGPALQALANNPELDERAVIEAAMQGAGWRDKQGEPEPETLDESDPDFIAKLVERAVHKSTVDFAKVVDQKVAPMLEKFSEQQRIQEETETRVRATTETFQFNAQLINSSIEDLLPKPIAELSKPEAEKYYTALRQIGDTYNIPLDKDSLGTERLSENDARLLRHEFQDWMRAQAPQKPAVRPKAPTPVTLQAGAPTGSRGTLGATSTSYAPVGQEALAPFYDAMKEG